MASNEVQVSGERIAIPEGKNPPGYATIVASKNIQQRERPNLELEQSAEGELKLGEFEGVQALSTSEARYIIDTIITKRIDDKRQPPVVSE